ncbi:LysE family translocator [Cohaesibacter celericrescens]|nr:LysE family translocator [Cohaesibacter celericrescens]
MIMSTDAWSLFLLACLMLNIAPGPDLVFVFSRTMSHGKKIGFVASLGVGSGALVHVFAAAFGVSVILATSATAFVMVKYIGAAYLVSLGLKAIFSREGTILRNGTDTKQVNPWTVFRQGVLIDVLNPKVALFFLAFLPQFIAHDASQSSAQIFIQTVILGFIVIAVGFVVETALILTAAPLGAYLRSNPKIALWLDRSFGGMLVFLGAKLASSDQ